MRVVGSGGDTVTGEPGQASQTILVDLEILGKSCNSGASSCSMVALPCSYKVEIFTENVFSVDHILSVCCVRE
jgi:hypothetical protein